MAISLAWVRDGAVRALRRASMERAEPRGSSTRPLSRTRPPRRAGPRLVFSEAVHSARAGVRREDSRDRLVFTPPDIIELTKIQELFLGILFEWNVGLAIGSRQGPRRFPAGGETRPLHVLLGGRLLTYNRRG
jgi:hypothetical protein